MPTLSLKFHFTSWKVRLSSWRKNIFRSFVARSDEIWWRLVRYVHILTNFWSLSLLRNQILRSWKTQIKTEKSRKGWLVDGVAENSGNAFKIFHWETLRIESGWNIHAYSNNTHISSALHWLGDKKNASQMREEIGNQKIINSNINDGDKL